jgi:membrane fusion protein
MRGLATVLLVLFLAAVVAAVVIQIPETVESRFVLVPAESAAPVRAPRAGTISQVAARPGDTVAAGTVLLVLRSQAQGDRSSERASLEAQQRADQEGLTNERAQWESRQRADAEEERRLTERLQALERMVGLRRESNAVYREVVSKYEELERQGLVSRTEVLAQQVAANQAALQLRDLESERTQIKSSLEKLSHERQERRLAHEQADRRLQESLEKARIRSEALTAELGTAMGDALEVAAPCAGVVLRLSAEVPGAFVQDGDVLGEVACSGQHLQAALEVPPGEVGRLDAGQGVKLLYDAFPYQRYGVQRGTVAWVGPAAVESQGRMFFPARVDVVKDAIVVLGKARPLLPGMGGRAKIVVGRRRLVSYVFEPLRQLQESVSDAPAGPQPRPASSPGAAPSAATPSPASSPAPSSPAAPPRP